MRIDGDGRAVYELNLSLTPKEAREVVGVLTQLLDVAPSQEPINENEVDDAPNENEGGTRVVRLVVYADPAAEQRHDEAFAAP